MKKTPSSIKLSANLADFSSSGGPHDHLWIRVKDGKDFCLVCRVSWADAMRGFGSNVAPPRQR